jgi:hypothetical protein
MGAPAERARAERARAEAAAPPTAAPAPTEAEPVGAPMGGAAQAAAKTAAAEDRRDSVMMKMKKDWTDSVNRTLKAMLEEIGSKPKEHKWAVVAFDWLPEAVLDKIVYAKSEDDVYNAIKEWGDPEILDKIWEVVKDDDAARQWIIDGVNIIKEMASHQAGQKKEAQ